ncbi:putative transcription factor GeBP family [Lupinus albus]|uniref:Putative transcription factor GeBP family n=1 Tax=Lupinus albus TaxID=3870 RepID=A0A6A4P7Q9_LUPAL|nr:putative transcription factor GeBP family [Lupinus albus]
MGKKQKPSLPPPSVDTSSDEFNLTPLPKHNPHSHSDDDDDDDDDLDDSQSSSQEQEQEQEDEDEDEEHHNQPLPQNPTPLSVKSPTSSDSDTDSGSDSDSDTSLLNSKPKPLASKPIDQTPKPNSNSAHPVKDKHALKRPAKAINVSVNDPPKRAKKKGIDGDGDGDEEMKDVKKSGGGGGESNSKKLFQRLWSEEDEIAILKGMVEFTSKIGQDPYRYADAFYDFMKKSLHAEASGNQLKEKIRRLKLKFEKNAKRGKNGEDPNFSKSFDRETFQLSKKVWGNAASGEKAKPDGKVGKSPKKGVKSTSVVALKPESKLEARSVDSNKDVNSDNVELTDASETDMTSYLLEVIRVNKGVGLNGLSEDVVKRGMELIGASERKELEGQWKELQDAELELSVKRVELIANHARLTLEALRAA